MMLTLGMIGGMSWESTLSYYRIVNTVVKEELGGLHSSRCLLYSLDFQEIETCQARNEWKKSAGLLGDAAAALERAGADFLIICTNTMHKVADEVRERVKIPLLHIADETARELALGGIVKVGLLGTSYTMEQDFYRRRLEEKGIEVLVPEKNERDKVNAVIYEELCLGKTLPESKSALLSIIDGLAGRGAAGVILGCTEIGLLVSREDSAVPLFDTAAIHARNAALYALGKL